MAISAALLFGVSLYAIGHTSGLLPAAWIVAAGRIFGVIFVALPLLVTGRLRITRAALPFVVVCGVAEVAGALTRGVGERGLHRGHGRAQLPVRGPDRARVAVPG